MERVGHSGTELGINGISWRQFVDRFVDRRRNPGHRPVRSGPTGRAVDVDDSGGLILETQEGTITVSFGEIQHLDG